MFRTLRVAAMTALTGLALILAAPAGHAANDAAIQKASQQLVAMGKDAYKTGQPPRYSDPGVKALLDTVYGVGDIALTGPQPFSQVEALSDRLNAIVQVGLIYTLSGTGLPDLAAVGKAGNSDKLNNQVAQNTAAFHDEMGGYMDSEVIVTGTLVESIGAAMAAKPSDFSSKQSQEGLGKVRSGSVETIGGVIETLPTPGMSAGWRRARLPALIAIMPKLAKYLPPEYRKQLHDVALEVAAQMKDDAILQAGLKGLADTIGG